MVPADQTPVGAEARPDLVLGTAGHIDHGKTALIRALTGVETDRLPEERERGITIELGFADLDLGDGRRVSVVDVPGHEKLVRTMVAGAAGMDAVLLAVAADEGVMPQTREHVAVCRLLGLERCVVALTKSDLVDDEMGELAAEEVRDLLAGTSLDAAEIVPVSSVTGKGLDDLRAALGRALDPAAVHTPRGGAPRLAVDRVFSVRGFGAVVTGTLVGGPLDVGDALEMHPGSVRAKVRGLQRFGDSVEHVEPGSRCAVNLQSLDAADLSRGQVLAAPDSLVPCSVLDAELHWLAQAPRDQERMAVEILSGTTHRRARLSPIGTDALEPGTTGYARIHVEGDPLPLLPGDRFVLRGFARLEGIGGTLGGGVVLDVAPPRRSRRDRGLLHELETFRTGGPAAAVRERIARSGLAGRATDDLRRETGLLPAELDGALAALADEGAAFAIGGERWMAAASIDRIEAETRAAVDAFHASEPLKPGTPRGALRGRLPSNVPTEAAAFALERLESAGEIVTEGDLVRRAAFAPTLDDATRGLVERIRSEARAAALEPPATREWAERLGVPAEQFQDLLAHLVREGALVRAPGDLWFDAASVEALQARVIAHLRENEELPTPAYKELIGTSRRTAVPLMELLDERHVTRRRGDVRVLRAR